MECRDQSSSNVHTIMIFGVPQMGVHDMGVAAEPTTFEEKGELDSRRGLLFTSPPTPRGAEIIKKPSLSFSWR